MIDTESVETLRVAPDAVLALGDGDTAWGVGPMSLHHLRHEPADCDHAAFARHDVPEWCRSCHLARVRYLAENWRSTGPVDEHPILIDVGFGDYVPIWPVLDGNHRILAAWMRGEQIVEVSIQGDWDRAVGLLVHRDLSAWDR